MTPTGPSDGPADGHVVLGGKYVLGDILGTGGTYTVYEAARLPAPDAEASAADSAASAPDSPATGEPRLLVKVLHPHLVDDAATRAAMARELAASDQVDHPGVAKVLDTGEDEVAGATVPWLLMRRLPGVPLSELVATGDGMPWQDALTLVAGLLEALGAVHEAGLVHRDVGPRNVVVDSSDDGATTVGLLDLGLAAPGGGDGDGNLVAGSAVCMSPEQAQGLPLDARSDLYSVGALAYIALTGHSPYERATPADVLRAHVGAPVPAPSARNATVPGAVDRFVVRAMAKSPARRFESAGAMAAEIATILGAAGGAGGTNGAGPDPDQTASMDQVADDPSRTASLGVAGATLSAAAVAATAIDAEVQRTHRLGAVEATQVLGAADATQVLPGDATGPAAAEPPTDEPPEQRPFFRRSWVIIVLALLLAALAVGAVAFWTQRDDGRPVAPVSHSPSPSPTPSPTQSTTAPPETPTTGPTSDPEPTTEPTETSTPTEEPTEEPTPTETSTPTEEPTTDEPTETSTPTEDSTPTEEPTETSTPTEEPTTEPPETTEPPTTTEPTAPGDATGGGTDGGADGDTGTSTGAPS